MTIYELLAKALKLLGILVLLQQLSCATSNNEKYTTHPDFYEYIENFENDIGVAVTIPISYENSLGRYAGVCVIMSDGYKYIKIKQGYWNTASNNQRIQLIYHELGHCQLGYMNHDNDLLDKDYSCPYSFMRESAFTPREGSTCFNTYFEHYIDDLKRKGGIK